MGNGVLFMLYGGGKNKLSVGSVVGRRWKQQHLSSIPLRGICFIIIS